MERGGGSDNIESLIVTEKDFNLYEQFNKGSSKNKKGLGTLYKVRFNDEEKMMNTQMLCRVIKFTRVKSYVIEEIFRDAYNLR